MDYYVYLYWRLDTNEIFYVGKGCNDRWRELNNSKRNKHFINTINKYPIVVEIIKDNLTEAQAFYWEEEIIRRLVFEYGYSIDIPNNYSVEENLHLVNMTWGGEGVSGCNKGENSPRARSVICITTMKIFPTATEGAEYYNINNGDISTCCSGKLKSAGRYKDTPLVWMYLDEYENVTREEVQEKIKVANKVGKGENNPKARSVICITTMKTFSTIREGAKFYDCEESNITNCCKGKRKFSGKYNGQKLAWMYFEDYKNATDEEIKERIKVANEGKNTVRSVICITTMKTFSTIREGAEFYDCEEGNIPACCRCKIRFSGKYNGTPLVWMYLEDYKNATDEEIQNRIKEANESRSRKGENHPMYGKGHLISGENHPRAKTVICLTTKKIFHTAKEGAKYYKCNHGSIIQCCKGKLKSCGKYNDEKLVWKYLVWQHNRRLRVINK